MIKVEPKPKKTIMHFDGILDYDTTHTFTVVKSINGEKRYEVKDIQPEPKDPESMTAAILNWCDKNGVGDMGANQNN